LDEDLILDHIAIAVNNADEGIEKFQNLGLDWDGIKENVESQGIVSAFLKASSGPKIEFISPLKKGGVLDNFLEKRGPGIHHICFKCSNIEAKCNELKEKGFQLIFPGPQRGADNRLVNFIHPKSTGGVLIELAQQIGD